MIIGFVGAKSEFSLFIFCCGVHTSYLLLYVDDIELLTASDELRQGLISLLKYEFSMPELGPINYCLVLL